MIGSNTIDYGLCPVCIASLMFSRIFTTRLLVFTTTVKTRAGRQFGWQFKLCRNENGLGLAAQAF